ncbi:hypothetical protein CFC21_054124 [Triticum aestivum]|uniref:Protein kinase domain-containing protein n=2 Tax=Triticum aestivum TaxID=4565 RepID=A0A3B6I237_WHEAT|nr:putative disease resistance protein RGA1 [Triticum aestivum]XP_044365622.1 putative disease resistance protein RGA1 [Triticum aestivum]KAF7044968.1 hypothetical protein CFC21_054124 [Triticum aestivum]
MESNLQDTSPPPREFPLEVLQRITNNFSDDSIIGEGGFGVVYKGVLENGKEVALKKLTRKGFDDTEFTNEFNNIIRAHHQNIVQFVGYCYHPGSWIMHNGKYVFAHEPTRILCFEYLHGGNLESHLSDQEPCRPDWQTCYKIIKGVSQGLDYLHNGHIDSIYHLDLKPANILLGNNMIPKIGDFGISRIFPLTKTITTATRMMGTIGFMPPEYIKKQEISPKYDVFSFGAIIIQIMAGRQSYRDCGSVPSEKLIELVCDKWRKLHPTMSSHTCLEVKTCITIALNCLEDDRDKRPTIGEILKELNRIDIETVSFTNEATNLQSREALAYNHNNNSGKVGAHDSDNQFKAPSNPTYYQHESVMRRQELCAIGGPSDVTQIDYVHRSRNPNHRVEESVHTHVTMDIMHTIGVTSGINEFVDIFQWARATISSYWRGALEQRFQNDLLFQLKSGLQFLSDTLPAMFDLINRAEWRSHNDGVAKLLTTLKDAVYDAEDLLDELMWYNHKVIVEGNASKLTIVEFFNSFIEVNDTRDRLKNISKLLEKMGLGEVKPRFDKTVRPETSSFPNETKIFGRDVVLEQIMGFLGVPRTRSKRKRETDADGASTSILASHQVSNESRLPDLPVLPIVGIGGVGKTTLAQHICSHPHVKSHFDTIIWICVSDDFDVKRLTKEAMESNPDKIDVKRLIKEAKESYPGKEATTGNLDYLQHVLYHILKKEKFLIVLDDMWDDALKENGECWTSFCAPLKNVLQGSVMLVTTRSQKVSDLVHTMEPVILEGLKDDVFWNFFKQCVFGSESSDGFPELELIGRDILPKLKGSPLAAKTLGRMLRDDLHTTHWNSILKSELWELDQETTEILPALRLSYMYLPFHLKRCFSFCAVYPKDKEFEKDCLVEIWAAEGFVKQQGATPIQDIGCQYFNDLLNRSFFQQVQGKYLIHDLLHDMAQKVSEDDCFIVKKKDDFKRIPHNVRHLSVLSSKDFSNSDLSILRQYRKLRTLICNRSLENKNTPASLMEDWCSELLRMRVIICASVSELPASIGKLKHLQYLEISRACTVTSLPATICWLHNLQVLSVKGCNLESLPSDFSMLVNLWRFETQGFKYGPNIEGPRNEVYYGVHICADDDKHGLGWSFINNMKHLRGHLAISDVNKLSKDHLEEAELKNKEYLDKLTLQWHSWFGNEYEIAVFRDLQPPTNVKSLVLDFYPGVSIPSWFHPRSLSGLTSVSFINCSGLAIPTVVVGINNGIMGFSSLINLIIDGCTRLTSLEKILYPGCLPVIKRIAIMKCRNLVSIPTERFGDFRFLETFRVLYCEKINSPSLISPSLKKLVLGKDTYGINHFGNLADNIQCYSLTYFFLSSVLLFSIKLQMWNLPALQKLCISYCPSLTSIGQSGRRVFTNLTSLTIYMCKELSTIDGLLDEKYLPAIESITFSSCNKLSIHSKRLGVFSLLKDLKVYKCHQINWEGLVLPSSLQCLHLEACGDVSSSIPSCLENLQYLVSLKISSCPYITSIPGHLWISTLSSLQELEIRYCWDLVSIGGADDISEIQNVLIEDCRNLKGIMQPVKRGSFLISKKQEQPVKTSSKSVWCS